jgi:hypothetical protein
LETLTRLRVVTGGAREKEMNEETRPLIDTGRLVSSFGLSTEEAQVVANSFVILFGGTPKKPMSERPMPTVVEPLVDDGLITTRPGLSISIDVITEGPYQPFIPAWWLKSPEYVKPPQPVSFIKLFIVNLVVFIDDCVTGFERIGRVFYGGKDHA